MTSFWSLPVRGRDTPRQYMYCSTLCIQSLAVSCCQSTKTKGEAKVWRIANRIWRGASSERMLPMFVGWEGHTLGHCLLDPASPFLLCAAVGNWGGTHKKIDPGRSGICLYVSCGVLFVSQGERQRRNSKLQGSFKHKPHGPCVSQQTFLLLSCTQFRHSPLLQLICSSASISVIFLSLLCFFPQRE